MVRAPAPRPSTGPALESHVLGAVGVGPGSEPRDLFSTVLSGAASGAATVVKPGAAAIVASTFGFPLLLMLLVIGFLVLQPRMDRRDPKLRAAPQTVAESMLSFEPEDEL